MDNYYSLYESVLGNYFPKDSPKWIFRINKINNLKIGY
ncbi:hypothetical protein MGSAQ_001184 [marine sediment metagenome]|uniref:Uncharacterized protein n=1 Tax=marine sediment metagenome TaxID=412755 RepID=A0A1B6NVH0_9ZZZZ